MQFTVYITLYNREKTISETIQSVLNQTYEDYELLIVNDGSIDYSGGIAEEYIRKSNKIKIVSQVNKGLFHARITAFMCATGDYVVALDADDMLEPYLLERLHQVIEQYSDVDLIEYCLKRTDFKSGGKVIHKKAYVYEEDTIEDFYRSVLFNNVYYSQCTKAIRRELLQDFLEIKGLDRISIAEDFVHTVNYLWKVNKAVVLDEPLYLYRYTEGSMTNAFTGKVVEDMQQVFDAYKRFNHHNKNIIPVCEIIKAQKIKISKILIYNPSVVSGREGRKQYIFTVQRLLENDSLRDVIYSDERVSLLYEYPLWLLRHKKVSCLLLNKIVLSKVRKAVDRISMRVLNN